MIRRILLFVVAVSLVEGLSAQMTLQEYRALVRDYSHTLRRAAAVVDGAEADMRVAKKGALPSLDMSHSATYDFRNLEEERRVDWAVRADLVQPIFYGGRVQALKEQTSMLWSAALSEEQSVDLDVTYSADVAYWSLSRAEIYCRAIERYRAIVASLGEVVSQRFLEGYISKSDLLQVESRLSDAEYQLSQAKQQRQQARHNFNLLCGNEPTCEVVLSQSILDSMAIPERERVEEIVALHPQYVAMVAEREAARWGVKVVRADYLPQIGVGVYGLWYPDSPNVKGVGSRLDGGVMISMSTPIFHFGERREAVRAARSRLHSAEIMVEDLVDEITLNESNGWTNLLSTQERVEAIRRNLAIAAENLEISTYAYSEGLGTILDVLQAQLSWLQIYSNAIAAQYDYAVAVAAYKYIVGVIEEK